MEKINPTAFECIALQQSVAISINQSYLMSLYYWCSTTCYFVDDVDDDEDNDDDADYDDDDDND